jgi:hypothetical protein
LKKKSVVPPLIDVKAEAFLIVRHRREGEEPSAGEERDEGHEGQQDQGG